MSTLAAGEILARLAAFGATALLARRLGPEAFGVIGLAAAIAVFLRLPVDGGLGEIGMREVARDRTSARDVFFAVGSIRLALATGAFVVLGLVAWLLPKPPVTQLVVLLTGLSFFSLALDASWVFKGLERPFLAGLGLVLAQVLYGIAVWLDVPGPAAVARVPVLQFGGELAAAVLLIALLPGPGRVRGALARGVALWRDAGYLGVARMLRTVVVSADVVMLAFLSTNRSVGLYTAAYRVAFLLMAIAAAVSAAHLPSFARVVREGPAATRRLLDASLETTVTIGAPLVVGVLATARPLLALLFGAQYSEAALALRLLAASVGLVFLHWTMSNLLIATDRTRLQAIVQGGAALLNITLNFVLIPRYDLAGAAAATLVTEAAIVLSGVVVMYRADVLPSVRPALRPLGAAIVMGLVVWAAARYVPVVAQLAVGGVVYTSMMALVRRR